MKTLNEYIIETLINDEELISKINSNLKDEEKIEELIKLPANVYHFTNYILPIFYKKYKHKIEKTVVKNPNTGFSENLKQIKDFNENKKYILIEEESYRNRSNKSSLKSIDVYIYDNGYICENYLCSVDNVRILKGYKRKFNGIIDNTMNIKYAYEVSKDLEWLYEFIKEGKMLK
jgi:hypothetical protein